MPLRSEEARVIAALIEKEAAVPDSYPMTLNALRLACNQTTNRSPVVAYDDRTVDDALLSLKSMGLVRFVHPAHGGRTTRYRHIADERWKLEPGELLVLAMLTLRGAQTAAELRSRVERLLPSGAPTIDESLDTLVARRPEPFATRLDRRPGEREHRFAHLLCGEPDDTPHHDRDGEAAFEIETTDRRDRADHSDARFDVLTAQITELRRRLEHLEDSLGVEPPG
jgi:uncharacterized protein YceH (UPF0502 family)